MAKNSRANLERLLRSAWQRQNELDSQSISVVPSKPKPRRKPKIEIHPVALWCRTIGFAALLLGMAGMILTNYFWWAIGFIFAGLISLFLDVFLEPKLKKTVFWRYAILGGIIIFSLLFLFGVVLVPAPLNVVTHGLPGDYAAGANIAGITWDPAFSDVRISIMDQTPQDYDSVDINVDIDGYVMKAVLENNVPSCTLIHVSPIVEAHWSSTDPKTGKPLQQPLFRVGDGTTLHRLRCEHLPSKVPLTMVIATANVTSAAGILSYKSQNALYGPKKMPQWIALQGTYRRGLKPYDISKRFEVQAEN